MDRFTEILDGPDYFFCEKTNCRLRISVCIRRQEANRKERFFEGKSFLVCEDCLQGIENMNLQPKGDLKLNDEKKESGPAPLKEKSESEQPEEVQSVRLCECGKPTISPNNSLCPSCMAEKANESKRNNSAKRAGKKCQPKPSERERLSLPLSSTAVIVEFKNNPDILEWITREAKEQIRTVSGQIIWTLKNTPSQSRRREPS